MSRQPEQPEEGDRQNMTAQGSVVAAMTFLSRILGFVRDIVLSYVFGATGTADAFFVAFRIPNFFRRLFAEGAFNQGFVPVLARYRTGEPEALKRFVAVMAGNLSAVLALVVVLGVVFAPALITLFAPGFWLNEARFTLATDLVRITFPYLGFISLTAFAGAVLNSHHRYAVPAFTPVLLNVCLISAALTASSWAREPVFALAWGVLLAGVVQLLFQLLPLARLGLLVQPRVSFEHEGARRVGRLLIPAVLASSVGQINALIDTMLASTMVTGSISWLYYSDRLLELPIGLVAVALGTVLLPNLSRLNREGDSGAFSTTLGWGVRMALLFGLPAAAALYVLALPLIGSIFSGLTGIDVRMAALSLQAFAIGLLPLVLVKVLAPAYFAQEDTRYPLRAGAVAVAVNVIVNLALFRVMGHVGLALGTSAAAWVNALLLARGLRRAGHLRVGGDVASFALKSLLATAVMVACLLLLTPHSGHWLTAGALERAGLITGLVLAGGGAYGLALLLAGLRPRQLLHHA